MLPLNKVASKLTLHDKTLLIVHENPDGDTLASASVLYQILKSIGKSPAMVCKDSVPKPFLFLTDMDKIRSDMLFGDYELIVVIDCGDLKRTGFDERLKDFAKKQRNLINIDHHPKNDLHKIANINLVDFNASSTAEIIWELLGELDFAMDKNIATALLCGLYTDTGGFKHSNTSEKTLKIASELLKSGARIKLITKNVNLNKKFSALKLWGVALERIFEHPDFKISSTVITRDDLESCNASDDDISGAVNLINTIPDSRAALLFCETADGKIRASLRTEDEGIDVSKIAALFSGGGHKKASGFSVEGRIKLEKTGWLVDLK